MAVEGSVLWGTGWSGAHEMALTVYSVNLLEVWTQLAFSACALLPPGVTLARPT